MSSPSPFVVTEHVFEGQHIREYPAATAHTHEDVLRLHAKSYTPHEVHSGHTQGDVTIIATHANATHKETYEPFFEELYQQFKDRRGLTIGSIWIADQAFQGTSAVLNDETLGNDPHWFDHSRDVLCMVNTFRSQMTKPIVGIGHSMGGSQLVAASNFHPGLFDAMVLVDPPMLMTKSPQIKVMLKYGFSKPESYPTRQAAEQATRKSPFFKAWDKRALQRFIDTAFREGETVTVPDSKSVKPTTPLHMEIRGLMKPNPDNVAGAQPVNEDQRYTHPDVQPDASVTWPFYNPHSQDAYRLLSTLRPPALFLLGKGSQICRVEELEHRTNFTGTAPGGSGGVEAGRVKSVTIPGGHFLPMTNIAGTAEEISKWLAEQVENWREREKVFKQKWEIKSLAEKQRMDGRVQHQLKTWNGKLSREPKPVEISLRSRL